MSLNIYIIYHKNLFEENTAEFTDEERKSLFKWVAVNESIPKEFPSWISKGSMIKEYEMRTYSPLMQMSNFYQNSVFFHLYWNKDEYVHSDYVGFAQYDMSFSADHIRKISEVLKQNTDYSIVFGAYPYPIQTAFDILSPEEWTNTLLIPYNLHYGTNHSIQDLTNIPIFLMHTFILPRHYFIYMMRFMDTWYPKLIKALNWSTRHLAGTLERAIGIYIALGILEAKFKHVIRLEGITHVDAQHTGDEMRGINPGKK